MPLVARYSQQGLMVAHSPQQAVLGAVALPYGGVIDTGGFFLQGYLLGNVAGTPTDEVWDITIGSATGTVNFLFTTPAGLYQTTFAYNAATATVETALEEIFGEGNVAVTGTPGTTYTVTFGGDLSERLMGGLVTMTATTANPTLVRTTPGSCGAGQYNLYSQGSNNRVDAILQYKYGSDPSGAPVTEMRFTSVGQPFAPSAYVAGYFNCDDLPNIDANSITLGKLKLSLGTAITQDGAQVCLVQ